MKQTIGNVTLAKTATTDNYRERNEKDSSHRETKRKCLFCGVETFVRKKIQQNNIRKIRGGGGGRLKPKNSKSST